ncbi:pre-peptidase C-terminal domain-containing protein [Kamptonema formosum]|uniref:pre-peptidase C-terminal domain-containing protein n=1 Tax=Kamptonema formosum TaxID=331992 RepID=UPI00034699D4|nr:pre-peptidase C-terminal domain-containing protein [Oscillatoria sp. PCC 10802]
MPDIYEANDSRESLLYGNHPANLGLLTGVNYIDASMESDGSDWFSFQTEETGQAGNAFSIDFDNALSDLDLTLYDANGNYITASTGTGNSETVSLEGRPAGLYYAKVSRYSGDSDQNYTITLSAPGGAGAGDDYFEENDDSTTATDLGLLQWYNPYYGLAIQSNDPDWFRFEIPGTGTYGDEVRIDFQNYLGDLDLYLYDANNTQVGASTSSSDSEAVSLEGLAAGVYYAQVAGWNGASNPDYTLSISAYGQGTGDDFYEENDDLSSATFLDLQQQNSYDNLAIVSSDDDWFSFDIASTGSAGDAVSINFDHFQGDLDLELYDASGNFIGGSSTTGDSETVSLEGLAPGTYYAKVHGYAGAENPNYSLNIWAPNQATLDDGYEDNDFLESATVLDLQQQPSLNNLVILSGDDDWFSFDMGATGQFGDEVRIDFAGYLGDLDLQLYDADGNYISGSGGTGDSESVSLEGLAAGTYYAEVYGYGGAENPNYSLSVVAPTGGATLDDRYEENDDLASATAIDLQQESYFDNLVIQSGDSDWFSFNLAGTGGYGDEVRIDFWNDLGDLDLRLYDASGNELYSSTSTGDSESISLEGLAAGTYSVEVYGYNGASNPNYTLDIWALTAASATGDYYEENDSLDTAYNLSRLEGANYFDALSIESGDDDWFSFELLNPGGYGDEVRIDFGQYLGDLDLQLYDASGNLLTGSYSTSDGESVSLEGLDAGEYYARIYGYSDASNPYYNLTITAPTGSGMAGDDRYEENDSSESAADLGSLTGVTSFEDLVIQSGDDDWFSFTTTGTGGFSDALTIDFWGAEGDLDLELLDANGNSVGGSFGAGDSETVSLADLPAGEYFAHVYGFAGASNNYTLTVTAPGGSAASAGDDFYEENDSLETASDLRQLSAGANTFQDLVIQSGDDDWFKFSLGGIGQFGDALSIDFYHGFGDLDLALYDAAGNYISSSTGVTDSETISLQGLLAGDYYAHVYGYNGSSNNYSLTINSTLGSSALGGDYLESNDSFDTATELREAQTLTGLSVHEAGNDDYFKFTLNEDGQFDDSVTINFTHASGDLDLELYNSDQEMVASSGGVGDWESISLNGLIADDYFVRVFGYGGGTNPYYDLTVDAPIGTSIGSAGGNGTGATVPDSNEPNDSADTASNLGTLRGANSNIAANQSIHESGNEDWFKFTTTAAGTVGVDIEFEHDWGDIDLEVYDATGTQLLGSSTGTSDSETVTLDSQPAGDYLVKVYGYAGATNPNYNLSVDAPLGGQSGILPDGYESNNTLAEAAAIRVGTPLTDLTINSAADQDWFKFTTTAAGTPDSQVFIDYSQGGGNLDLALYDSSGQLLNQDSITYSGFGSISLSGLPAGDYYAGVTGVDGATSSSYDLTVSAPAANPGAGGAGQDSWTIMVYIAGDNNLEGAGIGDINEMEAIGLPDNVNVVVQMDRADGYDSSNGDWTDTRRGLIQHDSNRNVISSNLQSLGELNTGAGQTLQDFVTWGAQNYAAENYAVVVWDHGGGLSGVAWDDASNDNLTVAETTQALAGANLGDSLKLVGFDACLQGMVEQTYDLKDVTDVVVASQNLEPGDGWDYEALLSRLAANPRMSSEELGAAIVDTYGQFYGNTETLSATRTSGYETLKTAMDNFSAAVSANSSPENWQALTQARFEAGYFSDANNRDLGGYMNGIAARLPESNPIGSAARAVSQALGSALINKVDVQGASGLSINLPAPGSTVSSSYSSSNYSFLANSTWGSFLSAFTGASDLVAQATNRTNRIVADFAETLDRSGDVTRSSNNLSQQAYDLGTLTGSAYNLSDLSIHQPGDVDWFRFDVPEGGTAGTLGINFNSAEGDLNLEVRDASQQLVANPVTVTDAGEQISLEGLAAGRYFVRVAGADATTVSPSYALAVTPAAAAGAVPADWAETDSGSNNNSFDKATNLGSIGQNQALPTLTGLTLDAGDAQSGAEGGDWYRVQPVRGTEWNPNAITINFDNAQGNLDLKVYDENRNLLGSSETDRDFESVSFPETSSAVYIQVVGAANPNYTLDIARRQLDIDGNGQASALSDGLMAYNYLSLANVPVPGLAENFDYSTLTGPGATRTLGNTQADDIAEYLGTSTENMLDVDGNGQASALSDGLMIYNYLSLRALPVPGLVENFDYSSLAGAGATRDNAAILAFLDLHFPQGSQNRSRAAAQTQEDALSASNPAVGSANVDPLTGSAAGSQLAGSADDPLLSGALAENDLSNGTAAIPDLSAPVADPLTAILPGASSAGDPLSSELPLSPGNDTIFPEDSLTAANSILL